MNRMTVDVRELSEHGLGGVPVLEVGWASQGKKSAHSKRVTDDESDGYTTQRRKKSGRSFLA